MFIFILKDTRCYIQTYIKFLYCFFPLENVFLKNQPSSALSREMYGVCEKKFHTSVISVINLPFLESEEREICEGYRYIFRSRNIYINLNSHG